MEIIEHGKEHYSERFFFRCGRCSCLFAAHEDEVKTDNFGCIIIDCPECHSKIRQSIYDSKLSNFRFDTGVSRGIMNDAMRDI